MYFEYPKLLWLLVVPALLVLQVIVVAAVIVLL